MLRRPALLTVRCSPSRSSRRPPPPRPPSARSRSASSGPCSTTPRPTGSPTPALDAQMAAMARNGVESVRYTFAWSTGRAGPRALQLRHATTASWRAAARHRIGGAADRDRHAALGVQQAPVAQVLPLRAQVLQHLRDLPADAGPPLRPARLVLAHLGHAQGLDQELADLERAGRRLLLGHPSLAALLHAHAQAGLPGRQARRPRRHGRARQPRRRDAQHPVGAAASALQGRRAGSTSTPSRSTSSPRRRRCDSPQADAGDRAGGSGGRCAAPAIARSRSGSPSSPGPLRRARSRVATCSGSRPPRGDRRRA